MNKSVIIKLGSGSLYQGFPRVTVQLWTAEKPLPEQFIGTLPAAPELIELYQSWKLAYRGLGDRLAIKPLNQPRSPGEYPSSTPSLYLDSPLSSDSLSADIPADSDLEISEAGITNISQYSFNQLCQQLQASINAWLQSPGFLPIEYQLRSRLASSDLIQVVVETNNLELRYLPWHRWLFFADYPNAEVALSQPEYRHQNSFQPERNRQKVKILAVLGNSVGIDLAAEIRLLQRLPDAEVKFLVNPSRQALNAELWQPEGWSILFFAGHSQTQGETGQIYINEHSTHNSLTIDQLEEALKTAIERGLQLAIFNSCDGLGLAQSLEKLYIPTVIVMREPIPNQVAQAFFQQFLLGFAVDQLPLHLAVQQARRKLQGLEDDFPAVSWLPVICQNLAVASPTWMQLGGTPACPYRGLFAFQEEDTRFFFGREQITQTLLATVKQKPLVAVIGASGSGKSSVVFAGLVPRLRQEFGSPEVSPEISPKIRELGASSAPSPAFHIVSFRPGKNPFAALADRLALCSSFAADQAILDGSTALSLSAMLEQQLRQDERQLCHLIEMAKQQNSGLRLVVIADQFEELYTLCPAVDRQPFLDTLLNAVKDAPAFTLILTLRADFCGYALAYRPFSDALQGAIQFLGPMNRVELQAAIEKPAAQMHVRLEHGLIQKLIHAMDGQPGRLPLLEFALTQLWSKQRKGWLTHQDYDQIGGVEAALANHAELIYAQLSPSDQLRSQRIFIQLVQPGTGTDDSRRLATRDDVQSQNWDLVAHLASCRLVVTNRSESTGEETIEIVHEALIRGWKRLRNWMQLDGEFRLWQEQLRATKRRWDKSNRDQEALLQGKGLADADYWQQHRLDELSSGEQTFIQQSLDLRDRELKQQKKGRWLTISGLVGSLVVALMLAGVASRQWQNSLASEIYSISTSSQALLGSHQEFDALTEAIRAKQKLFHLVWPDKQSETEVDNVLRQAILSVVEHNRWQAHDDWIWSVAFSADGQTIATASEDKTVKLWSPEGTLLTTLQGHASGIHGVAFSPNSQIIATAGVDHSIKLWHPDGLLLRTLTGHSDIVSQIAFSPDGQTLVSTSRDSTVRLWKIDGTLLKTLKGHSAKVWGLAFAPDGQSFATGSWDQTVKLWHPDGTLLKTLEGHSGWVWGVAFSPDGQILASASEDKTIKLWHPDGTLLKKLKGHDAGVISVAFSPDGQTLASASRDQTVKLWSLDGTLLTTLRGHEDEVWGVAFSADSQTVVSTSGDKTVKLWAIHNRLFMALKSHEAEVTAVAFSPDARILASASEDKTIKLWRPDGTLLTTLAGHDGGVMDVAFSADEQLMASASRDKTIRLWQQDHSLLTTLKGHGDEVSAVTFSPDSQTIASGSWDNTVRLWSPKGRLLKTLAGHSDWVNDVAFSPDGQLIASASRDHTVKLWSPEGRLLKTLAGHSDWVNGVAFSPDGQLIASASRDHTVKLWSPAGRLLKTLDDHSNSVTKVTFSADGQLIASVSRDHTLKLWNLAGELLTTLNGHSDWIDDVAFSSDGQKIASSSKDQTVILWNKERILSLDPLAYGCDWVEDYLKNNPSLSPADRRLCN